MPNFKDNEIEIYRNHDDIGGGHKVPKVAKKAVSHTAL